MSLRILAFSVPVAALNLREDFIDGANLLPGFDLDAGPGVFCPRFFVGSVCGRF
jgi:hypothetical protein